MNEYKLTQLYKRGLDHKNRNFIILFALLFFTVLISFLIQQNLLDKHQELLDEKEEIQNELASTQSLIQAEDELQDTIDNLEDKLALTDKVMPDFNNPSTTLSYIYDIFDKYNNYIDFDFWLNTSSTVQGDTDTRFNRYTMTGTSYINIFYSFIDQFVRQPKLITIENIDLAAQPAEEQGKLSFNIEFNAYYTDTGTPHDDIKLRNLTKRTIPYNIFFPRIYTPFVSERDKSLPDVTEIRIIGMTKDIIFYRNSITDKVERLSVGDRIRHGSMTEIDWPNQEAVFTINRTGLRETVRLKAID